MQYIASTEHDVRVVNEAIIKYSVCLYSAYERYSCQFFKSIRIIKPGINQSECMLVMSDLLSILF